MSTQIRRRTLLAAGAATAGLSVPGVTAYGGTRIWNWMARQDR